MLSACLLGSPAALHLSPWLSWCSLLVSLALLVLSAGLLGSSRALELFWQTRARRGLAAHWPRIGRALAATWPRHPGEHTEIPKSSRGGGLRIEKPYLQADGRESLPELAK